MIHIVSHEYEQVLKTKGIVKLDDFLLFKNQYCYKRNYYRAVYKLVLEEKKNIFLKIYHRIPFKTLLQLIFFSKISEARKEFDNILLIKKLGIKTLKPLGYGEKTFLRIPVKSFLRYSANSFPFSLYILAHSIAGFSFKDDKTFLASSGSLNARAARQLLAIIFASTVWFFTIFCLNVISW